MTALPFIPNEGQSRLIEHLAAFLLSSEQKKAFLLRGYAGTGKTSVVAALVKAVNRLQIPVVLLAPTGRAAKVMSRYADQPAFTIHKWIYRTNGIPDVEDGQFRLADNRATHTLFIVDEASMIQTDSISSAGYNNILSDLLRFIFSPSSDTPSAPSDNALLLLGDEAQLPPVGQSLSPALDAQHLLGYGLSLHTFTLTEVVRQALDSGILTNATAIRLTENTDIQPSTDVHLLRPSAFQETLEQAYQRDGIAETLVLTRSNRRANLYNQGIRAQVLWREDMLAAGDRLMVVKNNYFWTAQYDNLPFLANGDTLEVERLRNEREMYGFRFIDAQLRSLDYDWEIDVVLWLDTLTTPTPEDNLAMYRQLYERVAEDYPDVRNKQEKRRLMRESPYLNALQVRFAYAVTCHKAQGGQWENVFIDCGILTDEQKTTIEYRRWLYTALTRAKKEVWVMDYAKPKEGD
ncbi:MAG: AAA family ATPase [Paludibacteraceae bacterium]|nr:AAA family ATPase [Paludibacteraceae bacterium]